MLHHMANACTSWSLKVCETANTKAIMGFGGYGAANNNISLPLRITIRMKSSFQSLTLQRNYGNHSNCNNDDDDKDGEGQPPKKMTEEEMLKELKRYKLN